MHANADGLNHDTVHSKVMSAVVTAHPQAALEPNHARCTPLHIAMENKLNEGATAAILSACPDAANSIDGNRSTALHLGMRNICVPLGSIKALIAAKPTLLYEHDGNGLPPLQVRG